MYQTAYHRCEQPQPVSALACDSVAQRAGLDQVAVFDTLDLGIAGATINSNERCKALQIRHPQSVF